MPSSMVHLILGDGVAGMSAAQLIRTKRPNDRITVISQDPHAFYYRAALTNFLSGALSDEELWAMPPHHWEQLKIERVFGEIVGLDHQAKTVTLSDNRTVGYDRLLIATGCRARNLATPEQDPKRGVPGADLPGVCELRSLSDARRIIAQLKDVDHAVIQGGGILGIEVAHGLHARNTHVSIIHRGKWLMEKVIDRRAGELVANRMRRDGVELYLDANLEEIKGASGGVKSVQVDGTKIRCSLVVCCIGNLPNTEWLRDSGIELHKNGYVAADSSMRVSGANDVWAAGDVVEYRDKTLPFANPGGLWQPAKKQGQIAALAMAEPKGVSDITYRPGVLYNATTLWDLDLASLGDHVDKDGESFTYESQDDEDLAYKRILVRDDHVVGAMLLGNRREGHALRHLMNLRGKVGDVSSIKEKIFEPSFDLLSWVAARKNQPDVEKWNQTVLYPHGPLPPGLAAAADRTNQLQIASATPMDTMMGRQIGGEVIRLVAEGVVRSFNQRAIRIGALDKCDVVVRNSRLGSEIATITLEGGVWVLATDQRRASSIRVNGQRLCSPVVLQDGDIVSSGDWGAKVETDSANIKHKEKDRAVYGALVVNEKSRLIKKRCTMLGSSADNDVVIDDPSVALFHAQLQVMGSPPEFYVMDSGGDPTRGTFVNGERIYSPTIVKDGGLIQLGDVAVVVRATVPAGSHDGDRPPPGGADSGNGAAGGSGGRSAGGSAHLSIEEGQDVGKMFNVPLPATIGRSPSAGLCIDDVLLSREHVRLEQSKGGIIVTDLASTNGVQVKGKRLKPNEPVMVGHGGAIRIGNNVIRFLESSDADDRVESDQQPDSPWLELRNSRKRAKRALKGGATVLGRETNCDIVIQGDSISRRHCQFDFNSDGCSIQDLGSSHGTTVGGIKLSPNTKRQLSDGDIIAMGNVELVYRYPGGKKDNTAFRIDWNALGDPLEDSLQKTVYNELDSCIGCHECMRACPLEEADTVSIGVLNSFASGWGQPTSTGLDFVEHCTQCQQCVPVCPADIHRSRIVLWNKLKTPPNAEREIVFQVGERHLKTKLRLGKVAGRFASHPILGCLDEAERLRLFASAKYRILTNGEKLLHEGAYADAVWFISDGRLEVGMATKSQAFQRMVVLVEGQCVGEASLLSDQPSDVSVAALDKTTVIGFPKHSLKTTMDRHKEFRRAFESLYVSRSVEVFLRKQPTLADIPDDILADLIDYFEAERYVAGDQIMDSSEALSTFGIIKRGFVKEIRKRDGRDVISNYLTQGSVFGTMTVMGRGVLVAYEAGTTAEVLTLPARRLERLDKVYPGLKSRLMPADEVAGPEEGLTAMFGQAACEGVLQASRLLVIDTRLCVDCNNCVSACRRRHGAARLDRSGTGRQIGPYHIPASCFHCEDPVCLLCSVDGIVRESTGEIRIVQDNCIGCGACAERCPYDNIQMIARDAGDRSFFSRLLPTTITDFIGLTTPVDQLDEIERLAVKCDLCAGYDDGPACVRSCPTGAAQRVNPIEHFAKKS